MRRASALLFLLVACNSFEVGPIELKEQPSGTTVRAVKVRGKMTTIVGLTTQTETITSDTPKNSVVGIFEVRVEQTPPKGLQIASTSTCRVGDFTLAQPLTWNGGISHTAVGESSEFGAQYMPSAAAIGVPSVCEFTEYAGSPGLRDGDPIEPVRLATACWRPDAIVEGPCPADALPRAALDERTPVSIPALVSAGAMPQGKGFGVPFYFVVTANAEQPELALVKGTIACSIDGKMFEGSASALTQIDHLGAGESFAGAGFPFREAPLPTRPQWCTVELEHASGGSGGPHTPIGSWCIRDAAAAPGACE